MQKMEGSSYELSDTTIEDISTGDSALDRVYWQCVAQDVFRTSLVSKQIAFASVVSGIKVRGSPISTLALPLIGLCCALVI